MGHADALAQALAFADTLQRGAAQQPVQSIVAHDLRVDELVAVVVATFFTDAFSEQIFQITTT